MYENKPPIGDPPDEVNNFKPRKANQNEDKQRKAA